LGVGHNPHPIPPVRGIDGASWYSDRPDGVTVVLQRRKHAVEAQRNEPRRVLEQAPSGPEGSHAPQSFRPEEAVILRALSLPGEADGLTGRPAAYKVNWFEVAESGTIKLLDVHETGHIRPVLLQHTQAIGLALDLPRDLHPGPLQAEVEAADPREKGADLQAASFSPSCTGLFFHSRSSRSAWMRRFFSLARSRSRRPMCRTAALATCSHHRAASREE
jgi:hypothetical protein